MTQRQMPGDAEPQTPDPIDRVMRGAREKDARELQGALDNLAQVADPDVKINIHKFLEGAKLAWVDELLPPIEWTELMKRLRAEFGPGDYRLQVLYKGKIKDTQKFSVASPKSSTPTLADNSDMNSETLALFLKMSEQSADRQRELMAELMRSQAASADRQMQLMAQAFSQPRGGENAVESVKSVVELMKIAQPDKDKGGGIKEMIETLQALKDLAGGAGDGDTSILGLARSVLPELVKLASSGQLAGLVGREAPPADRAALPAPGDAPAAAGAYPDTPGHRLIAKISDDLAYFLRRRHDPALTADALFDVLNAQGVTLNDLMAVIAEFQAAPDQWPQVLAQHGVQLRTAEDVEWINAVLKHVGENYTGDDATGLDDESPDQAGQGGGARNPRVNGGASPAGNA